MNHQRKIQKILNIIYQYAPRQIEKHDLCQKADMLPRELAYLIGRFPESFGNVNQVKGKGTIFFSLDINRFENSESFGLPVEKHIDDNLVEGEKQKTNKIFI